MHEGNRPKETASLSYRSLRTLGVVVTALGLGLLVWAVGIAGILGALALVGSRTAVLLVVVGLAPVVIWGAALRFVLTRLGARITLPAGVLLFATTVFWNGVTPFGQLGGDPPGGLVVSHVTGTRAESAIAAVTTVNALNHVAVVLLGGTGAVWLAVGGRRLPGLGDALGSAAAVLLALVVLGVIAWPRRDALGAAAAMHLAAIGITIAARLHILPTPTTADVERRVQGFVEAIERLAGDPVRLVAVFGLGVAGQIVVTACLWLALAGVGAPTSPGVVLTVVPVAKLGGAVPLPGGSVGTEVLLTGLLVAAGTQPAVAAAGVLLYRAAAFWLPTVLGGLITVAFLSTPGRG